MRELIQGNEAVVRAAIKAGCRFYAGYPITPSSEIAHLMARELPKVGGVFIQMEDEIASIAAIIGAAMTGVKAMTATSGPGFSLMQENIGYAAMVEVPIVIVNVMRAGPSTGIPTKPSQGDVLQSVHGSHGDYPVIVLAPSDVKDAFFLTVRAFNLAVKYRTPIIILSDEIVGHMRESIEIPNEVEKCDVSPMRVLGKGYRAHYTGLAHDEDGFATTDPEKYEALLKRLHRKIYANIDDITDIRKELCEDAEIAVLTYGSPYRAAKRAVKLARKDGIKVGLVKFNTIFPFPEKEVRKLAKDVDTIIVPELNMGQYVKEVERVASDLCEVKRVLKFNGRPMDPTTILKAIGDAT